MCGVGGFSLALDSIEIVKRAKTFQELRRAKSADHKEEEEMKKKERGKFHFANESTFRSNDPC
jgi:hypothetical protein